MMRLSTVLAVLVASAATAPRCSPQAPTPPQPTDEPELTIPAYCGYAHPDANAVRRDQRTGAVRRCEGQLVFYVQLCTAGALDVALERLPGSPAQKVQLTVSGPTERGGSTKMMLALRAIAQQAEDGLRATFRGAVVTRPGPFVLTLASTDGSPLEDLAALHLSGPGAEGAKASTVERRNAASVHLWYDVPADHRDDVEWFYCELRAHEVPLWTYYMATGWHRGYFGMQVNSQTERRIIFSVWDAGDEAVDRDKVAAADRVQLVAKGENVHASGFGNEGTGGHSHLEYFWRMDDTVRFLVRAEPHAEAEATTYTGWFSVLRDGEQEPSDWRLVASFRAPRDGKRLTGLYSFSENFSGANGDRLRRCSYGNVWVRTHGGQWLPMTAARFTHDGHGNEHRLDRGAEVADGRFVLMHGDFRTAPTRRGERLAIEAQPGGPPAELPEPVTGR